MNRNDCDFLLPFVVDDALEGVDVITRYRRVYAAMLADEALHHRFVTALALCEEIATGGAGEENAPRVPESS